VQVWGDKGGKFNIDYDDVIGVRSRQLYMPFSNPVIYRFHKDFKFCIYGLISVNIKKIYAKMSTRYAQNLRSYSSSNKDFSFVEFLVQIMTQREGFLPKMQQYFTENA